MDQRFDVTQIVVRAIFCRVAPNDGLECRIPSGLAISVPGSQRIPVTSQQLDIFCSNLEWTAPAHLANTIPCNLTRSNHVSLSDVLRFTATQVPAIVQGVAGHSEGTP